MPISYHINQDQRLVVTNPYGLLTHNEVFGYQQEVWSRPEVSGYNEIIDMTDVSQIKSVSVGRMHELAHLSSGMDSPALPSKLAIIATSDLHFGLGRMYQVHREMTGKSTKIVRVFRDRQEALEWLGVNTSQV